MLVAVFTIISIFLIYSLITSQNHCSSESPSESPSELYNTECVRKCTSRNRNSRSKCVNQCMA